MKKCSKCKKVKSLNSFYNSKKTKDKLHTICKSCAKKSAYIWQEKNREKASKRSLEWYHENRPKTIQICKKSSQKQKDNLTDGYLNNLLRNTFYNNVGCIPTKNIPPILLKLKKIQIQIQREI